MGKSLGFKEEKCLLSLLKSALWGDADPPESIGGSELCKTLTLAREHMVEALVAHPVVGGKVKLACTPTSAAQRQELVMGMLRVEQTRRVQYERFKRILRELAALFRTNGIGYVVFKGVAVASHYQHPFLRAMGDIDFYVLPADFERSIDVLEREWHVKIERDETDKHYCFDWHGVRFELHHRIETFGRKRAQQEFDGWIEDVVRCQPATLDIDGEQLRVLPPVADVVVVFKHMINHLLVEGVGLRQVTDIAILLADYHGKIDVGGLRGRLRSLGYLGVFDAVVAMLDGYLGLPCAKVYSPLGKSDYRAARRLLRFVFDSGNFGRRAHAHHSDGWKKSAETAAIAFRHCLFAFGLMPGEILAFVPRRIRISIKKILGR